MSEPRGQLRKEHLTFPGCSHFRRLDDNHEKCQSCMYGGAPGCTRLSRCHFCADWTSSMWDAEEKNRQAAVKRRIRKKDKKASASSTGEPMRPGYESSSEVFSSRNPSPAHSRTSGYSGKGPSPKVHSRDETRVERGRSPSRGRHGVDEERIELVRSPAKAPRHEVRVERVRSPSPVCHERMEPFCSPSVTRGQERSPGVDTLLDYDEKGLSDDDFIGYDDFPKGFSGSSPEHSCEDDELLASPPRPHLTPLPVDSPKDNPGRVGVICHREEAGSARTLPPGDGKSRGSWTGHQGVATAPGDEDSRGLRRTRGEALPPVDQEGPQRVNQDHVQDMNPVLWNPSTFVDQDGTYFQVMGTNLPTQSVLVPQVPIMNPPAAAAGAPGQQASDPKFTMREFMDLMKFAQSQSVAGQRTSVTPVTGLTRQPAVPQKENLPPAVAGDNYPVESSTEVSASVSKHRSRTRTRGRKHRERRVERSRSPLMASPLSRLSPSISGETIQYEIGCRDPLRLEVRDGGRRVSIPDGRSHQRKDFSHDSRRNSRSRSRSPLRTESSSRRTSRSARSRRERRHSQSSTSRQRVSDDDGSDIMVSPSRYSIFRNAVRTSRGAYTSVNPRGEGLAKASMVHLSQDDKPEKVAWSVQPQLRHAIDHVSMLAQGVKKIDKVAKTPLCEHTFRESSFKFLKPNEVFDRKENFRLKVDPDSDFPIKPPHLDGSLGSFTMPASFNVPAACVSASEELSRRAAVYGSIADVMFSSIIHSLAPEDERAPLLKERITIAAEASMRSIKASVAVASNMQLVRRDVVLDHLLLNQSSASRARTAPFSGTHLMGPDPNRFYEEIMKLREQQVLHGGLSANFRNPAALGTAQSRSVWNRAQTNNRPRGTGARGRQPFRRPSTTARQGQQQGQSRQQRGQPQQQQGRGGFNRRGRRSRSNRNESAPGGSASAARHWDVAGRGSPDKFCPAVAESVRRLPCVSHAWERSAVGVGISTSTHQNTHLFQHQEYAQGLADGSGQALVQRGNRASVPSRNQGFLQPSLPGAEKDRGFTSCHRSLPLERPSGYSAVQDGDPGFSPGFHQRERMDCVHRHTGRISSRSHGKVCTEIPQIHDKRACVSVYMPPVRLGYLSSGVYQVAATSGPASAAPRYQAPCISGRLAHPSIVHRTGQNSCRFSPAGVTTPWMGNQFQQVRLGSQPAVRFYRHAVQHVRLHRGTSTQNAGQNPEHPGSLEITSAHIRQGSPQTFGYVDIHGHSGAKRSTTPPPNPVVGVRGMVPGDGVLVRQDFSDSDHSPSGGLVGLSCGAAGGFTECPRDRDNFIHRCLQSRMGGAAGLPYAARDVVSTAGKPAYKSVRDGGSVSECNSVPASTQVSGSAPDVRQRRGCFVHQQGRRDQIVQTDSPDDSALEILRPEGHQASACSSSRITQHPGRRSVASGPDSCDGVGHQWPASSSGVLCMGNTSDRSVRNFCQQEAACLRITISGPEGQIRRCDVSTVVRDGNGVRLPTIQDAAGCPQQDPQVSQPVGDLNSSTPDVSIMDARAIRAVSLSSNTTGRASTSYSRSSAAKRSRRDKTLPTLISTRLATLKGLFVKLGYSRRVAECMSTNLRPSSIGCYESHWSRFVEYCRRKHLNVFEVDSRIFSKYLLHLFENERYAPSTIISHRTSIASVLRHWKYDPATDPRLRALLRNFQLARPVQRRLMPQWDLHLVLTALLRPPFTDGANDRPSDDVIDLKWRTLKTTFLLALATARRRSFLHALCVSTCLFTRGDV